MIGYYVKDEKSEHFNIPGGVFITHRSGKLFIDFDPDSLECRASLFRNNQEEIKREIEEGRVIPVDVPEQLYKEFQDLCFGFSDEKSNPKRYREAQLIAVEIFDYIKDEIESLEEECEEVDEDYDVSEDISDEWWGTGGEPYYDSY